MQQLNNLDVIILIITAVSALIALCRGFVKEVLSIVGWVLVTVLEVYLLPVLTPLAHKYIASELMSGIVTGLVILVVFFVVWILSTDRMVGKLRTSKLSALDRLLGLFFGVVRAALIVILFNILMSWLLPEESQQGIFKDSHYYQLAGKFAEPIESLIPEDTMEMLKKEGAKVGLGEKKKADKAKAKDEEKEKAKEKEQEEEKAKTEELFQDLVQPKIEKAAEKAAETAAEKAAEDFKGYQETETESLDRLVETTAE